MVKQALQDGKQGSRYLTCVLTTAEVDADDDAAFCCFARLIAARICLSCSSTASSFSSPPASSESVSRARARLQIQFKQSVCAEGHAGIIFGTCRFLNTEDSEGTVDDVKEVVIDGDEGLGLDSESCLTSVSAPDGSSTFFSSFTTTTGFSNR
jgi:hypothetical protein